MTRCYKISAKGNFSKEMFFRSQWVVAFGKSWTLKYKVNSLMFIWHTSPFSALHIFRKSWREKSNKRREKIKSMELVGYSVIQHTVLKITSFTKHLFDLRSSRDTFEEYLSGWLVALFDISIWHIDCRYTDTFEKYWYRHQYRYGQIWKYWYRYQYR